MCELDMRETEILFFLLVVIMIRSRKTGSTALVAYLSNGFVYAKGANIILFFLADPRLCMVYLILVMLQVLMILYAPMVHCMNSRACCCPSQHTKVRRTSHTSVLTVSLKNWLEIQRWARGQ